MKLRHLHAGRVSRPLFALGLIASIHYAQAQTNGTWTANASGNWSDPANWSGGAVAGGTGATADFSTLDITGDHVITLAAPVTVGKLLAGDLTTASNNWTLAGANNLTFNNSPAAPEVTVNHAGPTTTTARSLTISAGLVGSGGLTKLGQGTLILSGNNSGLSGTLNLPDVTGTNHAGVTLSGTNAVGGLTTINIGGTSTTSGQFLALYGTTTAGSGLTINLNSQGGNAAPPGGLRAEGTNTDIVTVEGPLNITLTGNAARIANNTAKRLDITGPISGGASGITFRFGKNEGIHITNPANAWSGSTLHSEDTFWFDPGALPTTTNLQLCVSNPGTVQTSGAFNRALGTAANQVQFALNSGRAQGFGARGGSLTLNFGGAGADVLFDTVTGAVASRIRTNTLVLNGSTADSDITLVNPIDLNGAARTIQVSAQTATLQGGIKGGNFLVTKTSTGTLHLPGPSTWLGGLTDTNAGIVRISHSEALGAPGTVKTIQMLGLNRQTSILELTGGITVDAAKTLSISGKFFYASTETNIGSQYSMRNLAGNNAWLGSVIIGATGGSYGIESASGTLTLGADPTTTSLIQNTAAASSTRPMFFFGGGDFVINNKIADNGTYDTGINHVGSGLLSLTRADNDFDQVPNLWSGTTRVVKMADAGSASSIGTAASFNLGGTLRYAGGGDTSSRSLGLLQKGAMIDSSGSGPLSLTSTTMTHQAGSATVVCAPFASGVTLLSVDNAAGVAVGQSVTGTNLAANTTITAIDVATRQVTLSLPTTAASVSGFGAVLTLGGAANLDRTLALTGSNAGDNVLAANFSDPGSIGKFGVTKTGAGKWLLTGTAHSYSGPTTVGDGTLGFDGSFPYSSAVTVAPAATLSLANLVLTANALTGKALDIDGHLVLAGPVSVGLGQSSPVGTFDVIEAASITGVENLVSNYRTSSFASSGNTASITVGAGLPLTWAGATDGSTWDLNATANWKDAGDTPKTFFWGDPVRFDDAGSASPNVTLVGELRPATITVESDLTNYSFGGTGTLSGPVSLTKNGTSNLSIGGTHTFTGGITVNGGVLIPLTNQALGGIGQKMTIASGGALNTNGAMISNLDYEATITGAGTDGSGAIANFGADHQSGFRSLTLAGNATVGGSGRWDVRPVAAGTAVVNLNGHTLTKTGTNLFAMVDGSMTVDGTIDINAGTLALTRMVISGAGSINANTGATLRFENYTSGSFAKAISLNDAKTQLTGSNITVDAPITLTGVGTFDIAFTRTFVAQQPVGGAGALSFTSSGTGAVGVLTLQHDNTYAGATTVNTGTLRIGNRSATGSINPLPVTLVNNGTLQISRSDNACVFPNAIEGTGSVAIGANAAVTTPELDSLVTLTGTNTFTGGITVYSGGLKIQNISALGTGPKTINLAVNGTPGRPQFYLDGSGGNLTLPAEIGFVTSSTILAQPAIGNLAGDNVINGTITLTTGGGSTAVNVLGGSLALNGAISANTTGRFLILGGTAGAPGTVNGVISDGTNPLGVTMSGPNTWTFAAANAYTGTTTINGGTLLVNGAQNLATGNVTVVGGVLGGTGTVGGNVTVQAAGTIAPGASTGTLTMVNAVTTDGILAIEIDGTAGDKLVVGSALDIGGSSLSVSPVGAGLNQPVYIIAEAGAPIVGTFAAVSGIPAGYHVEYNYNGLNQLAIVSGTPYGMWETANGIAGAGAAADSDGDGIANGIEFVIGGDPSGPGSASTPLLPISTTDATYLNFVFRRAEASASLNPFVEYGTTLAGWTPAQHDVNGVLIVEEIDGFGGGIDRVTVRIPRALAAPGTSLFARLRVIVP